MAEEDKPTSELKDGKDALASRMFWGLVLTAFGPQMSTALAILGLDVGTAIDVLVTVTGVVLGAVGTLRRKSKITTIASVPLPAGLTGNVPEVKPTEEKPS